MARNKSDDKPFLKYYKLSQITAKVIKAWILIFLFIMVARMVLIELISKAIHFIKNAVTSNPDGYLKDLFPKASQWGTKFDERFLFDMDIFLKNSIIITVVLLVVYVLFIMLRHRNGEQAPFLNDIEARKVKRVIITATEATYRKTYKDENKKERKYKKSTVRANRQIRKCRVEIHTFNKYNATGMPPIKTYNVSFKKLNRKSDNSVMINKIKDIHQELNSEIDASFGEPDGYRGEYTSSAEKQLEKPKESVIVKIRRNLKNKHQEINEEKGIKYTYPLTLYENKTREIEGQRQKAEQYAEVTKTAIDMHLSAKKVFADKSEMYVINTSVEYWYTLPPNNTKMPNLEELQTTLDSALDIEGVNIKQSGRSIIMTVPLPKSRQVPIDVKTMVEKVYADNKRTNPTNAIFGVKTDGTIINAPISTFPHALITGTTGAGKSVFINGTLTSVMLISDPSEVVFIIIDPKGNEFGNYKGLPHMMTDPIIDLSESSTALEYLATEMNYRYQLFQKYGGKKDLEAFNKAIDEGEIKGEKKLPYIILMIDELANLMKNYKDEVESSIKDLGGMARAAGVHMILSTQTPRKEYVDGAIKANVATKFALKSANSTESLVTLGETGAEKLRKGGDFYASIEGEQIQRGQAPFIQEHEIQSIFSYLRENYPEPNLIDINDALEETKLKYKKTLAENKGENPDEVTMEDVKEEEKKSSIMKPNAKRSSRSEEERRKAREQHEKTMAQIEKNKESGSEGSKTISIDTSKFSFAERNKRRKEKGLEEAKPKSGVIPASSSKNKRSHTSTKTTQSEVTTSTNDTERIKEPNKSEVKTTQSKIETKERQETRQENVHKAKRKPTNTRDSVKARAKKKKRPTTGGGSPLARKR